MSFGSNPETAIAVFLGVIAWKQLCKGAPCGEGKCCSEASAPVPAPAVPAAVAPAPVAPVVAAPVGSAAVAPGAAAIPPSPAPPAPRAPAEPDDSALLAVLAAAVAVTLGPKARIVGFAPATHGTIVPANTAWSMEGRREIYLSHRIR